MLCNPKVYHQHKLPRNTTASAHTNRYKHGQAITIMCLLKSGDGKLSMDKCCLSSLISHQLPKNYLKLSDVIAKVVAIPCAARVAKTEWTVLQHAVNVGVCAAISPHQQQTLNPTINHAIGSHTSEKLYITCILCGNCFFI